MYTYSCIREIPFANLMTDFNIRTRLITINKYRNRNFFPTVQAFILIICSSDF